MMPIWIHDRTPFVQRVSLASDYNHSEFDVFVVVGATNAIIVSRSMQRRNVAEPASARARNMLHCSAGRCEWYELRLRLRWGRWAVEVLRLRAAETVGSRQKHESELAESIMERARQHMSYEMSANTDHPPNRSVRCRAAIPTDYTYMRGHLRHMGSKFKFKCSHWLRTCLRSGASSSMAQLIGRDRFG